METTLIYFSILIIIIIFVLYYEYCKIKSKRNEIENFEASSNFVQSEGGLGFDDIENVNEMEEMPFFNVQNSLKNLKGYYLQAKSHNTHFVTSTAIKDGEIANSEQISNV